MKSALAASIMALSLFGMTAKASIMVTPTVTGNITDGFTYSYSVANSEGSLHLDPIWRVMIPTTATITNVVAPTGWGIYPEAIDPDYNAVPGIAWWSTNGIYPVGYDIWTGTSLSGFEFTSPAPPGPVVLTTLNENNSMNWAETLGPVATPEPSTFLLFGSAIVGLATIGRRYLRCQ